MIFPKEDFASVVLAICCALLVVAFALNFFRM
jgi:hypothetical protein